MSLETLGGTNLHLTMSHTMLLTPTICQIMPTNFSSFTKPLELPLGGFRDTVVQRNISYGVTNALVACGAWFCGHSIAILSPFHGTLLNSAYDSKRCPGLRVRC